MISLWTDRNHKRCFSKRTPLSFLTNLFKKKKKLKIKSSSNHLLNEIGDYSQCALSVSVMDMSMTPCPLSPALSTLTLTPGRTRDIDLDMEALRLSRQDNPFLQVLASRESLVDFSECDLDNANLMNQDGCDDLDIDPLSLPEIHEHMIRSPPPITWPKSPNCKVFKFPAAESSQESSNSFKKGPVCLLSPKQNQTKVVEYRGSAYRTILHKPHQRSSSECRQRTLDAGLYPVVRSLTDVRRAPSSVQLQ